LFFDSLISTIFSDSFSHFKIKTKGPSAKPLNARNATRFSCRC